MNSIFSAMFEGSLLCNVGTPVREMYQEILSAYQADPDVTSLFLDLIHDWDQPDSHPFKMVAPFEVRAAQKSELKLAAIYSELAAATTMVDEFWGRCGMAYLLKMRLQVNDPTDLDIEFARQLLGDVLPGHPLHIEFQSWVRSETWVKALEIRSEERLDFEKWSKQFNSLDMKPAPFRSRSVIEGAANRMEYPELIEKIQGRWDRFSSVFSAVSVKI